MSEITDEAYSEAMNEIERLQIQLGAASASNQLARKLIGELADALEPFALSKRCPEGNQLIQRAREATK